MTDLAHLRKLINDAGLIKVYDGSKHIDLRKALLAFVDEHALLMDTHNHITDEYAKRLATLTAELAEERRALDEALADYEVLVAVLKGEP